MASGPCVTGVIGNTRPSLLAWGSAIDTANVLEQSGKSGMVHIDSETYHAANMRGVFELFACVFSKDDRRDSTTFNESSSRDRDCTCIIMCIHHD